MKFLAVVVFLLVGFLAAPEGVLAHGHEELFGEESCRDPDIGPYHEYCICAQVRKFGEFPKGGGVEEIEDPLNPGEYITVGDDYDGDGELPQFDEVEEIWVGDADDLGLFVSDKYGQECALSYVRENMRRGWYFLAVLGAGFAAISMTWVGVVYMQESSSGSDLTKARGMLIRVLIGLVIVTCALLAWEAISGFLLDYRETWTLDRDTFYRSYD